MSELSLIAAWDAGGDVLEIEYTDGQPTEAPRTLVAHAWVSALENHYPPEAYGPDGHRPVDDQGKEITPARPMTEAERRAYIESVMAEDYARQKPPERKRVL